MKRPIVSFTTDFGDDFALAQIKASVLMANPLAKVVTISNNITKFSILEGAFVLSQSYHLFPKGTIHIGVVDPGVGTKREGIVVKTEDYTFVGPNNGLFYRSVEGKITKIYQINEDLVNPKHSDTFHGRDIFARLAGFLSKQVNIDAYVKPIEKNKLMPLEFKADQVLHIDHFGNIKINRRCDDLKFGEKLKVKINGKALIVPFFKTFGDIPFNHFLAYKGSHEILEIAKNLGSANSNLNLNVGDIVQIEKIS